MTPMSNATLESLAPRLLRHLGAPQVSPPTQDVRLCQRKKQSEAVITAAWQRYRANPHDRRITDWLAYLLYANGFHHDAIPLLEMLSSREEATPLQLFHLGNAYHATGALARAIDCWEEVLRRWPDSDVARKSGARLHYLALILAKERPA
jgi:tetratricopeptide (TPR) repeat protein